MCINICNVKTHSYIQISVEVSKGFICDLILFLFLTFPNETFYSGSRFILWFENTWNEMLTCDRVCGKSIEGSQLSTFWIPLMGSFFKNSWILHTRNIISWLLTCISLITADLWWLCSLKQILLWVIPVHAFMLSCWGPTTSLIDL